MISLSHFKKIYLYIPVVDFRKGAFGLSSFVKNEMQIDPFESYLFLFCNRRRDRIKALFWDKNGFVLYYKCLEKEKYMWPGLTKADHLVASKKDLKQFLSGLDPFRAPHKKQFYENI